MKKFFALLKDKPRLYNIVFNSDTKAGKAFDIAVMVAITLSLIVAFIETKPQVMGRFKDVLTVMEYVLTFFFTIEYILRLYCSPRPKNYALSFFGIIDLLATLPLYLSFIPYLSSARYFFILRVFRLLRIFRVLKLFSFINEGYLLLQSIRMSLKKILVYFLFVLILVMGVCQPKHLIGRKHLFSELLLVGLYRDATATVAVGQVVVLETRMDVGHLAQRHPDARKRSGHEHVTDFLVVDVVHSFRIDGGGQVVAVFPHGDHLVA